MSASSGRILGVLGPVERDIVWLVGRGSDGDELALFGAAGFRVRHGAVTVWGCGNGAPLSSAASVADGRDCAKCGLLRLVLSQFGAETHDCLRKIAERKNCIPRRRLDVCSMLHGHPPYR